MFIIFFLQTIVLEFLGSKSKIWGGCYPITDDRMNINQFLKLLLSLYTISIGTLQMMFRRRQL